MPKGLLITCIILGAYGQTVGNMLDWPQEKITVFNLMIGALAGVVW